MHLRPVNLEENCLKDGIDKLLEELKSKQCTLIIHKDLMDVPGVPHGIENNIFRVTQEAVSNILRHSKATSFSVKLFQKNKVLHLIVEDNGVGIRDEDIKKTSYGLVTMRERIEELGGRFDVISYPNRGTRIEVRVPIGLQSLFNE
jgi:two-component system, NarL family, sensor histidine kinase LiaS